MALDLPLVVSIVVFPVVSPFPVLNACLLSCVIFADDKYLGWCFLVCCTPVRVHPKGGVLVFQIFGAGLMMKKLCLIGFNVTAKYVFDPNTGVVSPRGVLIMFARKPK